MEPPDGSDVETVIFLTCLVVYAVLFCAVNVPVSVPPVLGRYVDVASVFERYVDTAFVFNRNSLMVWPANVCPISLSVAVESVPVMNDDISEFNTRFVPLYVGFVAEPYNFNPYDDAPTVTLLASPKPNMVLVPESVICPLPDWLNSNFPADAELPPVTVRGLVNVPPTGIAPTSDAFKERLLDNALELIVLDSGTYPL